MKFLKATYLILLTLIQFILFIICVLLLIPLLIPFGLFNLLEILKFEKKKNYLKPPKSNLEDIIKMTTDSFVKKDEEDCGCGDK